MLIPAPVEEVFDYVADRSHLTTIWPSVIDIKDVKRLPSGGSAFQYAYKDGGLALRGHGLRQRVRGQGAHHHPAHGWLGGDDHFPLRVGQ